MTETLLSTIKTVALLLFYIAIGFLLGKKNVLGEKASKTLAAFLTFLVMPLYSVYYLSRAVSIDKISLYAELFVAGIVLTALTLAVSFPLSKAFVKKGYSRNIYKYMLFVPNLGYFGYPLVQAVFGNDMLAMFMIFVLPLNVALNTYGFLILTDKNANKADNIDREGEGEIGEDTVSKAERRKDLLKRLFSAPMIGTFVGVIIGLLPIDLPEIAYDFLKPASDCMSAIAMVLVGLVLSELSVKTLFSSKKAYAFSIVRLIILPVVFGGLSYLLYRLGLSKEVFIFTVCLTALPAGMNVVVFPEAIGMSGKEGAQACFISYILVIVTLPLVFLAMSVL